VIIFEFSHKVMVGPHIKLTKTNWHTKKTKLSQTRLNSHHRRPNWNHNSDIITVRLFW